jgi:hypothetical protein
MSKSVTSAHLAARSLAAHYRGEIRGLGWKSAAESPLPDDLDLTAMAGRALNYLRGNPDPQRGSEVRGVSPRGAHLPMFPAAEQV